MALITPKNGDLTAGLARQSSDTIGASPDPFLTGDYPAISSDIYPIAASLDLPPHTVVGFDSSKNLVVATYDGPYGNQATGTITFSGINVDTKIVTIGSTVYTSATVADDPYELPIAATAGEAASNLADAINGELAGTPAHPDVTAAVAGGVVTLTAIVGGVAGNSIATTTDETNATAAAGTLTSGAAAVGIQAIGVTKYGNDNSDGAAGENMAEVYRSGMFNPDLLAWDSSYTSDESKRRAFEGAPTPTAIFIRKPTTMTVA